MNENEVAVKLTPGQVELLLTKKLSECGAKLADRREIETGSGKSTVLVFSRFYKRVASVYGLTVAITAVNGVSNVRWNASGGKSNQPVIGDLGAEKSFSADIKKALEPYRID